MSNHSEAYAEQVAYYEEANGPGSWAKRHRPNRPETGPRACPCERCSN